MNSGLHLAADAVADLRRLPPDLQEQILDEVERLAADPSLLPAPVPDHGIVHAFARPVSGSLRIVVATLQHEGGTGRPLVLLGVDLD